MPVATKDVARRPLGDRSDIALASPASMVSQIELVKIRTDGGTQSREGLNEEKVAEYADLMAEAQSWQPFDEAECFYDGTAYWLVDGFHRVAAARSLPLMITTVPVRVHQGTLRDAILYSVGVNARHGIPRTAADKRRAVEKLLRDAEWSGWSDREIARRCVVSPDTVGRIRRELSLSDSTVTERNYVTKHGTPSTMNTANIGVKPAVLPLVYATLEDLQMAVSDWITERFGAQFGLQAEALEGMAKGERGDLMGTIKERLTKMGGIEHYREADLVQAIGDVAGMRRKFLAERAQTVKAAPPPVPSAYELMKAVERWVAELQLTPAQQHALLKGMADREADHPQYATMVAALPERWRKRELKQGLSNAIDSLSWKIGKEDWEARQLPSGHWYARNMARNWVATPPFDTKEAALAAAPEQANNEHALNYRNLDALLGDVQNDWQSNYAIRDASPALLLEMKIGLERKVKEESAPQMIADRLRRVEARVTEARQVVAITMPELAPSTWAGPVQLAPKRAQRIAAESVQEAMAKPTEQSAYAPYWKLLGSMRHWTDSLKSNGETMLALTLMKRGRGTASYRHSLVEHLRISGIVYRESDLSRAIDELHDWHKRLQDAVAPESSVEAAPDVEPTPDQQQWQQEYEASLPTPATACRVCGCTDDHACEGGCWWVEPDLCSACASQVEATSQSVVIMPNAGLDEKQRAVKVRDIFVAAVNALDDYEEIVGDADDTDTLRQRLEQVVQGLDDLLDELDAWAA